MTDNGWTVETLKEHLQRQHDDLVIRMNERHAADQRAITKAAHATERRFESVNEFRGQLADQAAMFLTRHEYDAKHEALISRLAAVEKQLDQSQGRTAGVRLSAGALAGGLSALAAFITVVIVVTDLLSH